MGLLQTWFARSERSAVVARLASDPSFRAEALPRVETTEWVADALSTASPETILTLVPRITDPATLSRFARATRPPGLRAAALANPHTPAACRVAILKTALDKRDSRTVHLALATPCTETADVIAERSRFPLVGNLDDDVVSISPEEWTRILETCSDPDDLARRALRPGRHLGRREVLATILAAEALRGRLAPIFIEYATECYDTDLYTLVAQIASTARVLDPDLARALVTLVPESVSSGTAGLAWHSLHEATPAGVAALAERFPIDAVAARLTARVASEPSALDEVLTLAENSLAGGDVAGYSRIESILVRGDFAGAEPSVKRRLARLVAQPLPGSRPLRSTLRPKVLVALGEDPALAATLAPAALVAGEEWIVRRWLKESRPAPAAIVTVIRSARALASADPAGVDEGALGRIDEFLAHLSGATTRPSGSYSEQSDPALHWSGESLSTRARDALLALDLGTLRVDSLDGPLAERFAERLDELVARVPRALEVFLGLHKSWAGSPADLLDTVENLAVTSR